ncbi:MAG: hemerythrin family protein [Spirochaetaceae bacterium]|jgi:hemerythrin|nr:hemerythrin family protein [Spirochaetaceae bacterium]
MQYTWDKSLETGIEKIDTQHQQLFVAVNQLLLTCNDGKDQDALKKDLDFLTNYTIKHFFEEEQIQQKYKYPDYLNHKKYHEEFKSVVRDLSVQFIMKGPSETLINDITTKIGGWLVSHIKVEDQKLATHIKAQTKTP